MNIRRTMTRSPTHDTVGINVQADTICLRGTAEHEHGPLTATGETRPWLSGAGLCSIRARRDLFCESICSGRHKRTGPRFDCIFRLHDYTVGRLSLHAVLLSYDCGPQLSNPGSGGETHARQNAPLGSWLPGSVVFGATKVYPRTGIASVALPDQAECWGRIGLHLGQASIFFSPTPSGCTMRSRRSVPSSVRSPGLIMQRAFGVTIF